MLSQLTAVRPNGLGGLARAVHPMWQQSSLQHLIGDLHARVREKVKSSWTTIKRRPRGARRVGLRQAFPPPPDGILGVSLPAKVLPSWFGCAEQQNDEPPANTTSRRHASLSARPSPLLSLLSVRRCARGRTARLRRDTEGRTLRKPNMADMKASCGGLCGDTHGAEAKDTREREQILQKKKREHRSEQPG